MISIVHQHAAGRVRLLGLPPPPPPQNRNLPWLQTLRMYLRTYLLIFHMYSQLRIFRRRRVTIIRNARQSHKIYLNGSFRQRHEGHSASNQNSTSGLTQLLLEQTSHSIRAKPQKTRTGRMLVMDVLPHHEPLVPLMIISFSPRHQEPEISPSFSFLSDGAGSK